ncbi:MAG TPA: hypothetical protein VE987_07070 [Polyangiaceae bacterium]|nr:hypothetical protein [Polyangiaceae bacterium]
MSGDAARTEAGGQGRRRERLLMLLAPAAAMAAVALGLRIGASGAVRAAVLYAAPAATAGTPWAWQVVTFDQDHGVREPARRADVELTARAGGLEARWAGVTNNEGVAEAQVALPSALPMLVEVRSGARLLAGGEVTAPAGLTRPPPGPAWARFARREGSLVLDVAVLGQRGASGFPASVWVRAVDAATHAPVPGASIELEPDGSLSAPLVEPRTDERGWAHISATPLGYAVALVIRARAAGGRTGTWAGALFISPGAARLAMRDRYTPDEQPELDVITPNLRSAAYIEVDDASGRAWAAAVPLGGAPDAMPHARVRLPRLRPGLYWAVASGDPTGAAQLGPGTIVRPFFVAASDAAALAFGTDPGECAAPREPGSAARAVATCLALAGATPVPRWTALDGFAAERARDARRRASGTRVALTAIGCAVLLETALVLRAVLDARARLRAAADAGALGAADGGLRRATSVAVALLVALLGFALLAAFVVRTG